MEQLEQLPLKKALNINLDPSFYGTFAEIGAGQEVARYFFVAGKASQTVAKTISAYDMTFSDSIYGKSGRYVSEERLHKMLDHEYKLLIERLDKQRGEQTRFFAMADTVATSSQDEPSSRCHGWMGIRFQNKPRGPQHDLILHVRMKDSTRLRQQQALGVLGVNMVALAHEFPRSIPEIVEKLIQDLSADRIEINSFRLEGPDFNEFDNRLLNLEILRQGMSDAVLFEKNGQIVNPSDVLFKKSVLVQRGTFRPVTNVNLNLLTKGLEQFKRSLPHDSSIEVLFEMTMNSLSQNGAIDDHDFLDRVECINALGYKVLISRFDLFYQLKIFLRIYTNEPLSLIIGASHLDKIFQTQYYNSLHGGIFEGFSRLFDDRTVLMVFPFKSNEICLTGKTFFPQGPILHLYRYLQESGRILDIAGCEDVDTSIHSEDVRQMLAEGNPDWINKIPNVVKDLILKKKMFGVKIGTSP